MNLFLQNLFIDILNMSLTASYVILFVLACRLLLKKAPKIFSYSLWSVVLFRLICPFSFSSAFSFLKIPSSYSNKIEYIPSSVKLISQPEVNTGINDVNSSINTSLLGLTTHAGNNSIYGILSTIWVLGFISLIVYSILSYLILKHKVCTSVIVKDNIFQCENISSPFVLGFVRPKIYLPIGLEKTEQNYILKHEQVHVKRFDYLIKPIAFLALCLHWFNPLVWISFMLMNKDMEMSCDERVLKEFGTHIKKDYSTSLLLLSVNKNTIKGNPLAFGENNTKTRIKNILNYKKPVFWVMASSIIAVIFISIGLITNPLGSLKPEENDFTEKIYKYRTPYVGDNSKVLNIINSLPVPETLHHRKIQLFTDKKPYGIQITYETTNDVKESFLRKENQLIFDENAAIIFSLVGNADYIDFVLKTEGQFDRTIKIDRTWLNNSLDKNLWQSSISFQGFNTIYKEIMTKFVTTYSLPILFEEGKKTNIQSVNDVPLAANYDKIKNNNKTYYIYEKNRKYYIESPYEFIHEITKETYEKLHTLIVSENYYENIKDQLSLDSKKYFLQNTIDNSCILDGDGLINKGCELANKFISDTEKGKKSSIKIIHQMPDSYSKGILDITEVMYDGKNYYGVKYIPTAYYSGTPGFYYKFRFKYIKTFDISTYRFVYLLEDNKVNSNDIDKSMLSKDHKDWVDYHFLYSIEK
ncbi:DUF5301 domain-containing protein [Clostridium kluyveri]|uniref:Predicted penicillin binding protein n=2 Tax=Clostridium kluyveri TaxID=1534 RepID=A5N2Z7_CLOK5|nr:DUF5301 domain-containing protein [Clostridium kluyveri]EDK35493.1 Predicted penicillin binding protein [Clostridium kluyveri DSM 555]BAH08140.1 hypothetical protein CKR_3089 [Clostridium kluyveri NBRC 12016]